jgi:hypothetical protein
MSTALRTLGAQPNSGIALKAYLDFCNYAVPGLMTEDQIAARIMKSMQTTGLKHRDMREAISKGFAAARGNQEPEQSSAGIHQGLSSTSWLKTKKRFEENEGL